MGAKVLNANMYRYWFLYEKRFFLIFHNFLLIKRLRMVFYRYVLLLCKFDTFLKFSQNFNDIRDEVRFNKSDSIIYTSFPRFHKFL